MPVWSCSSCGGGGLGGGDGLCGLRGGGGGIMVIALLVMVVVHCPGWGWWVVMVMLCVGEGGGGLRGSPDFSHCPTGSKTKKKKKKIWSIQGHVYKWSCNKYVSNYYKISLKIIYQKTLLMFPKFILTLKGVMTIKLLYGS